MCFAGTSAVAAELLTSLQIPLGLVARLRMSTPHSLHDEPNKDQNVGKFKKSVLLDIPGF